MQVRWVISHVDPVFRKGRLHRYGRMGWRIVLVKHPRLVLPQIGPLSPHSFTKGNQNLNVITFIDCLTFGDTVNVDNFILVKKKISHHGFEF